jgi:hypothetical protein
MSPRRQTALVFALLYPLGVGAMAINAFFASLLAGWLGARPLSPVEACVVGALVAVPMTWLFAVHMVRLARAADLASDAEAPR